MLITLFLTKVRQAPPSACLPLAVYEAFRYVYPDCISGLFYLTCSRTLRTYGSPGSLSSLALFRAKSPTKVPILKEFVRKLKFPNNSIK